MGHSRVPPRLVFRVWLARYENWVPLDWFDIPPAAIAVEPIDEPWFSAAEAAAFVETFNRAMLVSGTQAWAVAVPVMLEAIGDLAAGQPIDQSIVAAPMNLT